MSSAAPAPDAIKADPRSAKSKITPSANLTGGEQGSAQPCSFNQSSISQVLCRAASQLARESLMQQQLLQFVEGDKIAGIFIRGEAATHGNPLIKRGLSRIAPDYEIWIDRFHLSVYLPSPDG